MIRKNSTPLKKTKYRYFIKYRVKFWCSLFAGNPITFQILSITPVYPLPSLPGDNSDSC